MNTFFGCISFVFARKIQGFFFLEVMLRKLKTAVIFCGYKKGTKLTFCFAKILMHSTKIILRTFLVFYNLIFVCKFKKGVHCTKATTYFFLFPEKNIKIDTLQSLTKAASNYCTVWKFK